MSWTVFVRVRAVIQIETAEKITGIHSRTLLVRSNWDGEPPGYAGIPDNGIFLRKYITLVVCVSGVTVYGLYLRLNLSTAPDLKLYRVIKKCLFI
jgi:hypothetical protein